MAVMRRTFEAFLEILRCPCRAVLTVHDDEVRCASCAKVFPIVRGRPVLIDETRSVFAVDDYRRPQAPRTTLPHHVRELIRRLPSTSVNLSATRCFAAMKQHLFARSTAPVVLVVGSGLEGKGMATVSADPAIRLVTLDPSPCSDAAIFGDAHDLPFSDASVDGVVVQAVLEHVADPVRCVAEIHRVLKPTGIVYSEIPFMQQVHLEGFDFTRFTHVGHRRLFREFDELDSGAVAGAGTALAWSWRYFLGSLTRSPRLRKHLTRFGRVTGFAFELTDYVVGAHPSSLDAASCTYFLGTKGAGAVSDKDVLAGYRGCLRE